MQDFDKMKTSIKVAIERVSLLNADDIFKLNELIFNETNLLAHFEHVNTLFLLARYKGVPVGFKVGYEWSKTHYYSAKGGVLPKFRRREVGAQLLNKMIIHARILGYTHFLFDTFPTLYPGMLELGLKRGFHILERSWNDSLQAEKVRLEIEI